MRVVHRPARESASLALLPGVVATLALAINVVSLGLAVVGIVVAAYGTFTGSNRLVTGGTGFMYVGVIFAGMNGGEPGIVLLATAGTVVTWTTATHVVDLAHQLGQDAPVQRSVLVHLAGTTILTVVAGGIALAIFQVVGSGLSVSAAIFMLVGALVLLYVLEPTSAS